MGWFDGLFGGGAPEEAQSSNRAMQKEANTLEEKSKDFSHRAHSSNPFSRHDDVHETVNDFRAYRKRVENLKEHPGYEDFRKEQGNKPFVNRLDGRDRWTETELGVKETISSWDWEFNAGAIRGRTRPELPPSRDKK